MVRPTDLEMVTTEKILFTHNSQEEVACQGPQGEDKERSGGRGRGGKMGAGDFTVVPWEETGEVR